MGYGNWSSSSYESYSTANSLNTRSIGETFLNKKISVQMDPVHFKNGMRESRDPSPETEALPIIIGLDVTGSMGRIPHNLIKDWLPLLMNDIITNVHPNPQLMFVGIGDAHFDQSPIQASQFELETELVIKSLREIYLEGGGGGNKEESYSYPWLLASRFVSTDYSEKHNKRGILITIGDEKLNEILPVESLKAHLGSDFSGSISSKDLYNEVSKNWKVIHIHCTDGSYKESFVKESWVSVMNEDFYAMDSKEIVAFISKKIKEVVNYDNQPRESKSSEQAAPSIQPADPAENYPTGPTFL